MTSAPADPPRIRLSIAHLMLWTVGSALILACYRALDSRREDMPAEIVLALPFYQVAYSLTLGAQVGSLLLLAARRVQGLGGFPEQPGHWLLLVEGVSAPLMLAGFGFLGLLMEELAGGNFYWLFLLQIPNLLACTIGYFLARAKTARPSPWRLALGIVGLAYGVQCLLFAISAVTSYVAMNGGSWLGVWELPQTCFGLLLVIAVFGAALADHSKNGQRDFLHWAGIVTFVTNIVLQFVYRFVVIGV